MHVGRVRDCSDAKFAVDVRQDEEDHAIIDGLPFPYPESDPATKLELQGAMTAICRQIAAKAARLIELASSR